MDCGCGGGSNCITKHKKEFKKWVKAELKRLDCGCGCKGQKKFEEKYGKLVGGKLTACPEGWRDDGLTCVKNCKPDEKDDGLTCRAACPKDTIDDGLTCREPIKSSMNDCPPGSRDIWGTCWGPVRKDCVHDCFKHPAPGCKTWQCGRLEWAGIDWGPKLCTSCNLECGKTCWDVWGITKQLHERELRITGGEVKGKSIYSKEIRSKVDWAATEKEMKDAFTEAFGNDSKLARAFDPEKNGVAESFRKFGKDTKEAFDDIGRKIKEGFEKAMTPEFRKWLERHKKAWTTAFRYFFPPGFEETLKDPRFWIEVAIIMAEVAISVIAASATVASMGAAAPITTAIMVTALNMIGPSVRMVVKASNGEPIGANDISSLVLSAIPPAGKNAKAASSYLGKVFQFIQRNKDNLANGAYILTAGIDFAYDAGYSSVSTCLVNCPTRDDRPFPPPDNPNPVYIAPMDPPPPGQKTDAELMAMAPGNKPFVKFLTDGPEVNPDYVGTPTKWIKKKRRELYNYPPPTDTTGPAGNLETPEDQKIEETIEIPKDETPEFIQPVRTAEEEAEMAGFGRFRGGAIENQPLIEAEIVDGEYVNPMGQLTSRPERSGKEPPKGPGGCDFNPRCYAQNYPDLFNELDRDENEMTAYWTDVGKAQNHNPCCGARLVIGQNYEERHVKCDARNGWYDKETKRCDITRNKRGIKKTQNQFREDNCKSEGSFWEKGRAAYIEEKRGTPDFITGRYEVQRVQMPEIPAGCDSSRNLDGKNKVEEAARQQAEANKKTIDRIVKDDFFPDCYAANNPDVVAKVGNTAAELEKHFREFGIEEQRSSKCGEDLKHLKEASNKAKALEEFNAYCYAYNNPEVFKEVGKSYFEKVGTLQREQPAVLEQRLKQHFSDVGYAKRLNYSCAPRDSEYNWECFAENMRTIKNANYVGVNFNNEATVDRIWNAQKNGSWEYFDKGACKQTNLKKAKEIRLFNPKCYAFNNPELILQFGKDDAAYLKHFTDVGFDQGLDPSCDVRNETFKPECYGFANPDLNTTDVAALTNHWNSNGKNEWRGINCTPEQAETVFKQQYCKDTESFWDGANCDVTRHTNGTSKEQISNEVANRVNIIMPGQPNFDYHNPDWKPNAIFNQEQENELLELECQKCNGFFGQTNQGVFFCDCHKFPNGDSKSQYCHEQNEYYDEVTRLCDPNRVPSGETPQAYETRLQNELQTALEEENKRLQKEIEDELKRVQEEMEREKLYCEENNNFWTGTRCDTSKNREGKYDIDFESNNVESEIQKVNKKISRNFITKTYDEIIKIPGIINLGNRSREDFINNCDERANQTGYRKAVISTTLGKDQQISCGFLPENDQRVFEILQDEANARKELSELFAGKDSNRGLSEQQIQANKEEAINAEINRRFELAVKKFMGEQYDLTAQIPGIKPNAYNQGRDELINTCAKVYIDKGRGRTKIGMVKTDGGSIGCDAFVAKDDPIFDGLKAEKAKIISEVTEEFNNPIPKPIEEVLEEQIPERVIEASSEEPYNDSKVYQLGDVVTKDGITYKMIDGIGAPGYPPPRPTNWQPVITGSSKPASLTLYWAEWCPHCHDLLPVWQKLGKMYKGIKIQALEEKQTDFQVDGYPTIIFRNGRNMEKYEGKRNKNAILNFLKNKLSKK
jgi:thiol-disulfide isomerase/thioredoxin